MTYAALLLACLLALEVRAEYVGPAWQIYLFKPLLIVVIVSAVALTRSAVRRHYRLAILSGLICSLAGDVFLMLPGDRFVFGLGAFLLAHLCYIDAFVSQDGFKASPRVAGWYGTYYILLLTVLRPYVDPALWWPVVVYGLALTTMGWQAAERWAALRSSATSAAAIGGVLFVLSDSLLALNRFVLPFRAARAAVMVTYLAAQWFIAQSAVDPRAQGVNR